MVGIWVCFLKSIQEVCTVASHGIVTCRCINFECVNGPETAGLLGCSCKKYLGTNITCGFMLA